MTKDQIIKQLRDMAKHPTVTLPRDCEALKAAADLLAQPEQEPVACQHKRYSIDVHEQTGNCIDCGAEGRMSFIVGNTTPPQRKPLTDEQIEREWQFLHDEEGNPPDHHDFARAIEAAHGIKGDA